MIDTLQIGVGGAELERRQRQQLERDGWQFHYHDKPQPGEYRAYWTQLRDGVRLKYMPGIEYLTAEANLPKLSRGTNAQLAGWAECQVGALEIVTVASEAMRQRLPDPGDWRIARIDPVYAWAVDPTPYLSALALARLPRTKANRFDGSGVQWRTRGNHVIARAYDKRLDPELDIPSDKVKLPLRMERQILKPRRYVIKTDTGKKMSARFGSWSGEDTVGVLRRMHKELGMDQPMQSAAGTREALIDAHGKRHGTMLFEKLCHAQMLGGWEYVNLSTNRVATIRRELAQAGITGIDIDGELAPLPPPSYLP